MIKQVLEISKAVMQEQLLDDTFEGEILNENVMDSGRTSEKKQDLNGHVVVKAKSFKCPKCILLFGSRKLVQLHVRKKHGSVHRRFETCPICSTTCKYKSVLSVHMNNHREKVCPICSVVASDSEALKNHIQSLHIGKLEFVCPMCFKLSIDRASHDDHVSSHNSRRRYECADCSKYYASHDGLERHRQTHAGIIKNKYQDQYGWSIYSKAYSSVRRLRVYMKSHSGTDRYKCDQCPKYFSRRQALQSHRKTHSCLSRKSISFKRNKYPKDSTSRQAPMKRQTFRLNMNLHNDTQPYECDECPNTYAGPQTIQTLSEEHTGLPRKNTVMKYECSYCSKSYSRKDYLSFHINTHTGARPFKCDQCPRVYASTTAILRHRKRHMPGIKRRVKCSICSKYLSDSNSLRFHMNIHSGSRPYRCDQCPKSFPSPSNLKQHRNRHQNRHRKRHRNLHMNSHNDPPFECLRCEKAYPNRRGLARHHRAYPSHGNYEYKCSICFQGFSVKHNLDNHMKTHLETPLYECDECPQKFHNTSSLLVHRRIHRTDGKNMYKCSVCYETFSAQRRLDTHMNVHDGLRPYKCDQCRKDYLSHRALQAHLKKHLIKSGAFMADQQDKSLHDDGRNGDGLRPYKCDQCPKGYLSRGALKTHLKKHLIKSGEFKADRHDKSLHDDGRPYKCNQCPKDYLSRQALQAHQKKHLIKSSEIRADRHDKSLQDEGRNGELDKITGLHTALAKFRCKECDKEFISERNLSFHLRQHVK